MEMEYKDPSKRGRFIVLLGLVLAIVAGGAAFYLVNNATNTAKQQGAAVVSGYVAAVAIPAGKPLAKEQIVLRTDIPASMVDPTLLFTKEEEIVGLPLAIAVPTGQILTRNMLGAATAGLEFTILDPLETVAPDAEAWTFDRWAARQARWAFPGIPRRESEQLSPAVLRRGCHDTRRSSPSRRAWPSSTCA